MRGLQAKTLDPHFLEAKQTKILCIRLLFSRTHVCPSSLVQSQSLTATRAPNCSFATTVQIRLNSYVSPCSHALLSPGVENVSKKRLIYLNVSEHVIKQFNDSPIV
jgi:hypothetical protein